MRTRGRGCDTLPSTPPAVVRGVRRFDFEERDGARAAAKGAAYIRARGPIRGAPRRLLHPDRSGSGPGPSAPIKAEPAAATGAGRRLANTQWVGAAAVATRPGHAPRPAPADFSRAFGPWPGWGGVFVVSCGGLGVTVGFAGQAASRQPTGAGRVAVSSSTAEMSVGGARSSSLVLAAS